jgi:hypothetical protein
MTAQAVLPSLEHWGLGDPATSTSPLTQGGNQALMGR